jgi:hypothetical protein
MNQDILAEMAFTLGSLLGENMPLQGLSSLYFAGASLFESFGSGTISL